MKNKLFTPYTMKSGLTIKNRFVKAAMNEAMGTKHLQPQATISTLYEKWAKGGTRLIITGNVMVDSDYLAELGNVVFNESSDKQLLKKWAKSG